MPLLLLVHHGLGHLAALKGHAFLHAGLSFGIVLVLLAFIGPALERFFMAWRSRVLSGETRA
jgi:hypothetical protein